MTETRKKRMLNTKMVPAPSQGIIPERDLYSTPVLEARHLGIEFGGLKAVEDFNLIIGKTEIAGLIGPNGAGKIIVNGPAGTKGIKAISTFPAGFVLILFALFVVLNLINSRSGRAIMATRDNRIAAEAMGINVTKYKMMAFVTAAVLAGMAGALYGLNFSTVAASKFKFDTSILVLVFVVLGGIGNIWGSIIAAALLTVLPELLRTFADYRMLVYAIVLILVMLVTNNPMLRSLFSRIGRRGSRDAQTQVGGADE